MKFSELPIGAAFLWKEQVLFKVSTYVFNPKTGETSPFSLEARVDQVEILAIDYVAAPCFDLLPRGDWFVHDGKVCLKIGRAKYYDFGLNKLVEHKPSTLAIANNMEFNRGEWTVTVRREEI